MVSSNKINFEVLYSVTCASFSHCYVLSSVQKRLSSVTSFYVQQHHYPYEVKFSVSLFSYWAVVQLNFFLLQVKSIYKVPIWTNILNFVLMMTALKMMIYFFV